MANILLNDIKSYRPICLIGLRAIDVLLIIIIYYSFIYSDTWLRLQCQYAERFNTAMLLPLTKRLKYPYFDDRLKVFDSLIENVTSVTFEESTNVARRSGNWPLSRPNRVPTNE